MTNKPPLIKLDTRPPLFIRMLTELFWDPPRQSTLIFQIGGRQLRLRAWRKCFVAAAAFAAMALVTIFVAATSWIYG